MTNEMTNGTDRVGLLDRVIDALMPPELDLGAQEQSRNPATESASDAMSRIRATMPAIFDRAREQVERGELPLIGWGLTLPRVQRLPPAQVGKSWYFIGDLHGDFLAWHCLFNRVRSDKDFRLCFLGDLVDRGQHHVECFAALLEAAQAYPGQILWIIGNHEEAVRFDLTSGRFTSDVDPSEFAGWLNAPPADVTAAQAKAWGRLLIDVCRRLPRAVLFPEGTLATHGGIPLGDRWDHLKNMEAFHHERALGDFTWTRASSMPFKAGWKYAPERRARSSDFEFGYKDLEGFCKATADVFNVKRLVRGHDHVAEGAEVPEGYDNVPVLTLNGFGFDYLSNSFQKYRPAFALGVFVPGELPRVEQVPYQLEDYDNLYRQSSVDAPPQAGPSNVLCSA